MPPGYKAVRGREWRGRRHGKGTLWIGGVAERGDDEGDSGGLVCVDGLDLVTKEAAFTT
jgi:hypothetical protein